MKLADLTFEKVFDYSPYNEQSNRLGMVKTWVGRNQYGNAVVFGKTKNECLAEARKYVRNND